MSQPSADAVLVAPDRGRTATPRAARRRFARPRLSRDAARDILRASRAMAGHDLVVGTTGNVSRRLAGGFAITPTRTEYQALRRRDLVVVGTDGHELARGGTPSREWPLHAGVYRARPDVHAVVHTHSVYATAWSFQASPLPRLEDCDYYGLGDVRIAERAAAGTSQLADAAVVALGAGRAVLLGGHGVLTVGRTAQSALTAALVVERQAMVAWLQAGRCAATPRGGG